MKACGSAFPVVESVRMDNTYIPEAGFYAGNGKLVSGDALQNLAEYLADYRCMDFIRKAFADILEGFDMSNGDRMYYKQLAGLEE
jgi:hypothetical protein